MCYNEGQLQSITIPKQKDVSITFMKEFFKKYKHAWILSYLILYMVWFAWLEQTVTTNFHVVHMAVDDYIPFIEIFIIPYLLWFGYVAVAVVYFFFTNVPDYYKLCRFLFVGMTVFLVVSTIYPNGHYLRPSVFRNDNIFTFLVQCLYATDTSTNLFPSIHVYNSIGVHLAISRSEKLRQYKWVQIGSGVLMTSIILSTMFLKQHSVFDVVTAFAMATVMYSFVYGRASQPSRRKVFRGELQKI